MELLVELSKSVVLIRLCSFKRHKLSDVYSSDKKPCIKDSFKECFVLSKSLLSLSGKSRDEI